MKTVSLPPRLPVLASSLILIIGLQNYSLANDSLQQGSSPRIEFYRDEVAFKRGIKLYPFEVHDADYLKVNYNERDFVDRLQWFSRGDALQKSRTYTYWPDDMSVKRMLDFTPDSLILRELLFGDESKSNEVLGYLYGVDHVSDFRNRFTEVIYDSSRTIVAYKIMATQGQLIGAIFLDYDSLGFLTNESWFQGDEMERVREFRYIFHRASGEQEVIERGRKGEVVSHVRIKLDPNRAKGYGLGDSVENIIAPQMTDMHENQPQMVDPTVIDSIDATLDNQTPLP